MANFVPIFGCHRQLGVNFHSSYLAALCALPFATTVGCAQETAASPLQNTQAYSLFVNKGQTREQGYFPMGFVHGLPERTVGLGFNFQQGLSSATNTFASGVSLIPPSIGEDDPYNLSYGNRNLSMARPAEALGGLIKAAATGNRLPLKSNKYGEFATAVSADGKARATALYNSLNLFDPATRRYLVDYVREHVRVRVQDKALNQTITLWGLDNEWEGQLDYSPQARSAFKIWLEKAYGNQISQLNAAWKTSFNDFAEAGDSQLPTDKEYKQNPALFLDWINFQTENFTGIIAEMAEAMHQADPLKRGVILKSTQQTIEMPEVNRTRTFDNALLGELIRPYSGGLLGIDIYGAGDREAYEVNYIANCIRPNDYWANNASNDYGVFLGEANNHSGPGHQFASTYWRVLPNGLKGVNYFTLGFAGAQHDWVTFGFTDSKTGQPKDKLFYAARWANMVHRSEKFWTQSRPASGLKRVALLMPRRDVLLSDKEPQGSRWAYPENKRWLVYRWLREQGYWVDVIPYTRLNSQYLAGYQGLFLIGAEHLSKSESDTIKTFVQNGGTLVADSKAGYFDEHHRVVDSLRSLLGVRLSAQSADKDTPKIKFEKTLISGKKLQEVVAEMAKPVTGVQNLAYLNKSGQGNVLYFPFELGTLTPEEEGKALDRVEAQGPTADNEEYAATAHEFTTAQWLAPIFKSAGLSPAYNLIGSKADLNGQIRVEQPVVDSSGNCAVVISNRAQQSQELLPSTTIDLSLPEGNWQNPLWAGAESDGLQEVKISKVGGSYRVSIPPIRTAGVMYLFKAHEPLLGISQIAGVGTAADGATAQVKAGTPFKLHVQLFNPNGVELPAGDLKLQAYSGWKVVPPVLTTARLKSGQKQQLEFEVIPEADEVAIKPNFIYPLVAQWEHNGQKKALITANVEVKTDPQKQLKILSDNAHYPETYPYRIKTGITYTYPDKAKVADPALSKTATGQALLNGFSTSNIGGRASGRAGTKNYALYNTTSTEILFDLKNVYRVRQLKFVPGPGANAPIRIQIFTSVDGKEFHPQKEITRNGTRHEIGTPLFDAKAQFVRTQITWAKAGGTLDEVEVFGVEAP